MVYRHPLSSIKHPLEDPGTCFFVWDTAKTITKTHRLLNKEINSNIETCFFSMWGREASDRIVDTKKTVFDVFLTMRKRWWDIRNKSIPALIISSQKLFFCSASKGNVVFLFVWIFSTWGLPNKNSGKKELIDTVDGSEILLTSWYGVHIPLFTGF